MLNIGGIYFGPLQQPEPSDLSFGTNAGRSAEAAAQQAKDRVRVLEDRVDKLALVCQALWTLLQEKTSLRDEDLLERVKFIDLLDGKEDGKRTKYLSKCPRCQRTMSPRHQRCLYCGFEKLEQTAFDKLT